MIKFFTLNIVYIFAFLHAQVTGLSGWNIYLDPGHSQTENMGVNGYSEAEEVLRVGLELKDLLLSKTDIDTVYISRTNDQQQVSLSHRTDHANSLGADWYHSIHSNAGPPDHNNTLLLWGQLNNGNPDPPAGGEAMSSVMIDLLTRGMRIPTIGSWGDCSFYTWSDYCENSGGPYLWVNRHTSMPSELSEEGHHTNPAQNQLYMNSEYKRLLAYIFYWSILDHHGIQRPDEGIVTGIISDLESGNSINGAEISVGSNVYKTNTYDSLFSQYSSDPDLLRNGFYFFEDIDTDSVTITVAAEGYYSDTLIEEMIDTFFTFKDIELISNIPPKILETDPVAGDTLFPSWNPVVIQFSRAMDTASVTENFSLDPIINGSFSWISESTVMTFYPDSMNPLTDYTITISDSSKDRYGHLLDGDGNGEEGGDFNITFKTGPPDMSPPEITFVYPPLTSNDIELQPIINISFDELVNSEGLMADIFTLERFSDHSNIPGTLVHSFVRNKSVLNFFPDSSLKSNKVYLSKIESGLQDDFGNTMASGDAFSFLTGDLVESISLIDNFESGMTENWWAPQQSGSTTGILTDSTNISVNTEIINHLSNSNQSMEIHYGWDTTVAEWLLREYLATGAPKNVTFSSDQILEAFVFGDGSGTLFRFCVDDNVPQSAAQNHEVSPWYPINWIGWKRVRWDMSLGHTGSWIGDGYLDGNLRFDSIQLSYADEASQFGSIIVDDLRLIELSELSLNPALSNIPSEIILSQNYPNPFNHSTVITYTIIKSAPVELSIYDLNGRLVSLLDSGFKSPGNHSITWKGENNSGAEVPSGFYIYRLISGPNRKSKKLLLLK